MSNIFIATLFIVLFAGSVRADNGLSSLFYSAHEVALINKAVENEPPSAARRAHQLAVSSLIYVSPSQWVVWLNDHQWNKLGRQNNVHLNSVSPEGIVITLYAKDSKVVNDVFLALHQCIDMVTGQIFDRC